MSKPIPQFSHDFLVADWMRDDDGLRSLTLLRREIPHVRRPEQSNEEYITRWFEEIPMDSVERETLAVRHELFLGKFLGRALTNVDYQPRPSAPGDIRLLQALRIVGSLLPDVIDLYERKLVLQKPNAGFRSMLSQMLISILELSAAQYFRILGPSFAAFETPFYRYHRPLSNLTEHVPGVGLFCGAWHQCCKGMPSDARDLALRHLEGVSCSSPFISVSDRPRRIRNFVVSQRAPAAAAAADDDVVYVISPSKLRQLDVAFTRSTDLVEQAGRKRYCRAHPNGIRHATPSHWMVERWVPEACIVATLTMDEFEACCAVVGITGRKYVAPGETPENDIAPSTEEMLHHRDVYRAQQEKMRANTGARAEGQGASWDDLKASTRGIDEMAEQLSGWSF